jgi:hypothetical protein
VLHQFFVHKTAITFLLPVKRRHGTDNVSRHFLHAVRMREPDVARTERFLQLAANRRLVAADHNQARLTRIFDFKNQRLNALILQQSQRVRDVGCAFRRVRRERFRFVRNIPRVEVLVRRQFGSLHASYAPVCATE